MANRLPGRYYSIHEDTMQALADAARLRTGSWDEMTPPQMISKLNAPFFEEYDIETNYAPETEWTRPEGWPDLDSLNVEFSGDQDVIYMTYDADAEVSAIAWHIDTLNRTQATVDIGHIENGEYIADHTFTVNNNTNFIEWLDDYSGYVVVRISGTLAHCYAVSATRDGVTQAHRQQPVLERVAYVPNMAYLTYSISYSWGMWLLEREKIGNGSGAALTSISNAWNECGRLRSLDVTELYTQNVTGLASTFYNCMSLTDLDLRHWNVEKVTSFNSAFYGMRSLKSLDLTGWNTVKANNMGGMFQDCRRLRDFSWLAGFTTTLVTTFSNMFNSCYSAKELPVEGWDPGNVTTMSSMFNYCRSLKELDLHEWDVGKLTNTASMFYACHSLKKVNITGWQTGTLTNVSSMFQECHSLQEIDLSGIIVTSACTTIQSMFNSCFSLKELDLPEWDVSGLGSGNNTGNSVFANCYSLERITGIANWNFQHTNSIGSMFNTCRSLREVDVSGWNVSTVTSLGSMFLNCYSLKELDLSGWNPANCTTLSSMFQYCYSLRSIGDISGWNVSKVTTLASMFSDCQALREIADLSNWDVSKVTTTASMFSGCANIREITIKDWNLAACTTIATMFRYCYTLEKAVLTGWQIPKVTATAPAQFLADCYNLKDLWIFPIPLNHSYSSDRSLSHESLIRILESLPTVTTARTINLTSTNVARLSAAEKAIATAKRWTVAN